MSQGLGKEGKRLTSAADKFVYGFGKGFQDSFYKKANAVRLGRQFSDTIEKMFEHVFGAESAKALRDDARKTSYSARRLGVSGSGLTGFGQALGIYGGNEGDLTSSIKSLNSKMTGLNFGNAEFLNQLMLLTNGKFNIYGSGPRGFKTGAEMHDEFARWANETQKSGTFDPGVFEQVADSLQISGSVRDMILDGEYENMKARRALTQDEIENAANMAKAQKKAEFETNRLMKRLGVLGAELRQPLDELSIYLQKNLLGWLADKLTPEKSEKEVDDNVKNNAAAIDATLTNNEGGMKGAAAGENRQEAAKRLYEKFKAGALSEEDVMAQSVNWVRAEGLTDVNQIKREASKLYYAAKKGRSQYAFNDQFKNVKEFSEFFDKEVAEGLRKTNEVNEGNRDKKERLEQKPKWYEFWKKKPNKTETEEFAILKDELANGANKRSVIEKVLTNTNALEKERIAYKLLHKDDGGVYDPFEHHSMDELERIAKDAIEKKLNSLSEERKGLAPQEVPKIRVLDQWKQDKNSQQDGGFYLDDGNGGKRLLPPGAGLNNAIPTVSPPMSGDGVARVDTRLDPTYNIYIQPTESVNNPEMLTRAIKSELVPAFVDIERDILAKCSPILSRSSTCGATG